MKEFNEVINTNYSGPSKSVLWDKEENQVKVLEKDIDVKLINWPDFKRFRNIAPYIAFATWETKDVKDLEYDEETKDKAVSKILNREVIPSTQETLQFTFGISGMTYVEVARLIRRRSFAFQAECTGDSGVFNKDIMIPANIAGTEFEDEYIELAKRGCDLCYRMVRAGISIMDARQAQPKTLSQTYYFTAKWNDLITFIDSYTDMYVNDCIDAIIGLKVVQELVTKIPELKKYFEFKLQKSPRTAIWMYQKGECSNLFLPEDWYAKDFEWKAEDFLYQRQRTECNAGKYYFDELEKTRKMLES